MENIGKSNRPEDRCYGPEASMEVKEELKDSCYGPEASMEVKEALMQRGAAMARRSEERKIDPEDYNLGKIAKAYNISLQQASSLMNRGASNYYALRVKKDTQKDFVENYNRLKKEHPHPMRYIPFRGYVPLDATPAQVEEFLRLVEHDLRLHPELPELVVAEDYKSNDVPSSIRSRVIGTIKTQDYERFVKDYPTAYILRPGYIPIVGYTLPLGMHPASCLCGFCTKPSSFLLLLLRGRKENFFFSLRAETCYGRQLMQKHDPELAR